MIGSFVTSMVLVTLAELGDKTQMISMVLAARYSARRVMVAITLAIVALQVLAVAAGGLVGSILPTRVIAPIAGTLFVGFGILTLRAAGHEEHSEEDTLRNRGGSILGIAGMFFVAELGDKTQLMTVSLSADPAAGIRSLSALGMSVTPSEPSMWVFVGVLLGSIAAMLLVNGLAVAIGAALGSRLSPRTIARVSGTVFIAFGVLAVVSAFAAG